jgi:hypothetical protein
MTELIELKLSGLNQLFNSMDPSPFRERDLDRDAEEFIVSWASEHSRKHELRLVVHLANAPEGLDRPDLVVSGAIGHYFDYRATMTGHELKRLLREGRAALLVGLVFLGLCQFGASTLAGANGWRAIVGEGLLIVGWVAMWKPLEIGLYRWWPLVAQGRLYRRLSRMPVEVVTGS